MPTSVQSAKFIEKIKSYQKRYMKRQFSELDESATRIMINAFLTEVLEYQELDEIKTEYAIRGEYADYVIQLKRKKQFVVEVKSVQLDLNEKHLRQSVSYAANEGIDWIILTNGRSFQFYRVLFEKPIRTELLYSVDLTTATSVSDLRKSADMLFLFSKKSVEKEMHELFWQRSVMLSPANIAKLLYAEDVVKLLRKNLKKDTNILFDTEQIKEALKNCLVATHDVDSLRFKLEKSSSKKLDSVKKV